MIIEHILKGITADEEGKERGNPLRMSSSGKCARQLAYQFHKFKPEPLAARAILTFRLGHTIEAEIKSLIQKYCSDMNITYPQDTFTFEVNGVEIPGHVDGHIDNDWVLEIKSISDAGFKMLSREGLSEDYKKQSNSYMKATGRKKTLFIFYCKNTSHLKEIVFEYDPKLLEDVKIRFSKVIHSTKDSLPDREYGPNDKGKLPWNCSYCAYWRHCWPTAQLNFDKNNKPQMIVRE